MKYAQDIFKAVYGAVLMKLHSPLTNSDLQRVWELAKVDWLSRHNVEYEPNLFVILCYLKAYCGLAGLPLPVEIYRDHYGPDEYPEIAEPINLRDVK